jgi:hypothetical protein
MSQEPESTGRTLFSVALLLFVFSFVLAMALIGIVHVFG